MSHKPALNDKTRCTHRTADGRRCQSPLAPNHTTLCANHALQDLQLLDMKAVSEEIVGPLGGDFRSAHAINRSLGKLFTIAAENRIPRRNAALLAYIGQLLIQTLNPLREEALEMGLNGHMHAIFLDAAYHVGGEASTILSATTGSHNSTLEERVEESLTMVKNAGIVLSPDIVRQLRTGREDDEDEADEEEVAEDEENRDSQTTERSGL
jgi:hypothetical protein